MGIAAQFSNPIQLASDPEAGKARYPPQDRGIPW